MIPMSSDTKLCQSWLQVIPRYWKLISSKKNPNPYYDIDYGFLMIVNSKWYHDIDVILDLKWYGDFNYGF